MSIATTTHNLTLYSRTNFYNEFNARFIQSFVPDVKKVKYYICPWHFHELPDVEEFKRAGIDCEIIILPHFDTDLLLKNIQEQTYDVSTCVIVQKILSFQREAWNIHP
jgi:hypothetical protein